MSVFKIVNDIGAITYIKAKTRREAVQRYCEQETIPLCWAIKHIKVVNLGKDVEINGI